MKIQHLTFAKRVFVVGLCAAYNSRKWMRSMNIYDRKRNVKKKI